MKIAIKENNAEKIQAAIDEVQKRTTARNITAADVFDAVETIEKKLDIPKKSMLGIIACVDVNAQNFPNAYKYVPESTMFQIEKFTSGWFLTDVYRERTRTAGHDFRLGLPEEAKAAIIKRMTDFER